MSNLFTGGPFRQNNGSAITVTSTDVNGGAIKTASSSTENLRAINPNQGKNLSPIMKGGVASYGMPDWGTFGAAVYTGGVSGAGALSGITESTAIHSGLIQLNAINHGLITGNVVHTKYTDGNSTGIYNNIYRVIAVPSANAVVLNGNHIATVTGILYAAPRGTIASQEAGQYSMKKLDGRVHGLTNTKLQSGAADYGRVKVASIHALRTVRVATAIRAGLYNVYNGTWSTKPTVADDYGSLDTNGNNAPDDEVQNTSTNQGVGGEFSYRYGGPVANTGNYEAKTG